MKLIIPILILVFIFLVGATCNVPTDVKPKINKESCNKAFGHWNDCSSKCKIDNQENHEYEFQPDATKGIDTTIQNGTGPGDKNKNFGNGINMYAIGYDDGQSRRILMDWTSICDEIPASDHIISATLEVYGFYRYGNVGSASAYPLKCAWEEGNTNDAPGFASWNYPYNGSSAWSGTDGCRQNWDIITNYNPATIGLSQHFQIEFDEKYFEKLCDNTLGDYDKGFVIINNEAQGSNVTSGWGFLSSDSEEAKRPKLIIQTTSYRDNDGIDCISVCDALCECGGIAGFGCPKESYCKFPTKQFPDMMGYCVPSDDVTNFEECIAAGNPDMESYPRQCRANDRTFTEEICVNVCGDGNCQEIVCQAEGCPCAESKESCPQDC